MSALVPWRRYPVPGSRRAARDRSLRYLQQQGKAGPGLVDVLPAFALVLVAVAAPVVFVAWLYSILGVLGLLLGLVVLAALLTVAVRRRRSVVRRRSGRYTTVELGRLSEAGLVEATERMLRRDGWRVRSAPWGGVPRLMVRDRARRVMEVTFREPDTSAGTDAPGPAPLRRAGTSGYGGVLRLVVSRGEYTRDDVLWASRQGGVFLLNGGQLEAWATGTDLTHLVGIAPVPAPRQGPDGQQVIA